MFAKTFKVLYAFMKESRQTPVGWLRGKDDVVSQVDSCVYVPVLNAFELTKNGRSFCIGRENFESWELDPTVVVAAPKTKNK